MHTRFIYWIYLLLMEWLLYITTNWRIMIQGYLIFTLVMNFKSVWLTCTVQLEKFMSDIGYFSVSILRGFGEKKIMAVAVSTKKELWLGQCPWKDLRLSRCPWWNSFPKYLGRLWWLVNNKNEQKRTEVSASVCLLTATVLACNAWKVVRGITGSKKYSKTVV